MPSNFLTFRPALTRRAFLSTAVAAAALPFLPRPAQAMTAGQAQALVDAAVADVNRVISSGGSDAAVLREMERILSTYADVPTIARSVLGPPARTASAAQLRAFTDAFQDYFAAKYGRRFREFIGGTITVQGVRPVRSFFEVISVVNLRNAAPFELRWLVSDGSGRPLFFNLIIEGVNLMISERTEIGAMLEARGGNIDALTQHLRTLG
ncbi:ABC transporter substrate-binding protein [Rhodobacteraceae bacterium N5(2021)]|uniref:ABC transporter substrate-binding protein n=1 Tax=Gymnodinialimonas phycosphaerae TaxID=2841589 RepID=A0A975TUT4_9RHOB|nr:ABC transporter substrate-binding protein [Gymnodinialimonas phycosphaerae]MBY4894503.1 ABC transporter substrate-binding protein [Gymnodinialimonas phycosphaerae]